MRRGLFPGTAALFAFALLGGGLGPHAPVVEALIEAVAFCLLMALLVAGRFGERASAAATLPFVMILLLLALGLAQMWPLPSTTWQALPGREVPASVFEALGIPRRTWPLSFAPADTRLVLQSLLPPVATFLSTLVLAPGERQRLAALVVAAAAVSSLIGLAQLSTGDGTLLLYPLPMADRFPGLFANPNHQALFLACAVALLPALAGEGPGRRRRQLWLGGVWLLIVLGALVTSSRTGLTLLALATVVAAVRIAAPQLSGGGSPRWLRALLVGIVLVGIGSVATLGYRGEVMQARFGSIGTDARSSFWAATMQLIHGYLPWGTGLGTFETVYQMAEPLESVQPFLVNHAHNDYLEFVLETGVPGIILLALFGSWLGGRMIALARHTAGHDRLAGSGLLVVLLVLCHSVVDYPLRTQAVGCVFAFACALLVAAPRKTMRRLPA